MSETLILNFEKSALAISLDGGNILSWQIYNPKTKELQDILYRGSSPRRGGIPILFPFANPLENNTFTMSKMQIGQHGFARDSQWNIKDLRDKLAMITLSNHDISPEMRVAYPFEFECKIIIEMNSINTLKYTLIVENLSGIDMPIAPGLHPYFPLQHNQKSELEISDNTTKYSLNQINWNNEMEGNFYQWNDNNLLCKFPNMNLKIVEKSEVKQYENIVVWSQTPEKNDVDFVCIEPFSKETNVINTKPILIKPKSTWSTVLEFSAELL